jgi:hypothetical protein
VRPYHTFNLLSLDVALGAVISAAFFGRILHVSLLPQGLALLGIIVWLIYTADHLLDAWSMRETATSERHRFHQENFITILIVFFIAGVVAVGLMFLIRVQVITTGMTFGALVIVYLLVNRWLKYFKELTGSLLYVGGVMLPSWSLHTQPLSDYQLTIIVIFTLIVLTNMLIFARFSIEEDILNRQKSLATIMGIRSMNTLITIVCVMCFGAMVYQAIQDITPDLVVLMIMELILVTVFVFKYFRYNDRYRVYGDAIFLLPAVLVIVPLPLASIVLSLPSAQ